jgi:hypothetical protein
MSIKLDVVVDVVSRHRDGAVQAWVIWGQVSVSLGKQDSLLRSETGGTREAVVAKVLLIGRRRRSNHVPPSERWHTPTAPWHSHTRPIHAVH